MPRNKDLESLIESTAYKVGKLKDHLNYHLIPSINNIKKILNPEANGTYVLFISIESFRRTIAEELIEMGIDWEPWEQYTWYFKDYMRTPFDMVNRPSSYRVLCHFACNFEGRIYRRFMQRYLYKAREAYRDYLVKEKKALRIFEKKKEGDKNAKKI